MKNELGDIPKISLDDDKIPLEDQIPNKDKELEQLKQKEQEIQNNQEINKVKHNDEESALEKTNINDLNNKSNINYYTKEDKFNKIITIILIVAITIIVVLVLGFGVKKLIDVMKLKKQQQENKKLAEQIGIQEAPGDIDFTGDPNADIEFETTDVYDTQSGKKKVYYKGFEVVGYIKIPKINLQYPILKSMTNKSLEVSVAVENTTSGINQPGNTTISGHNYKNNQFFSNNYKIQIGDLIYIKDMTGQELKYEVYDIKELAENDKSYVQRNTQGAIEISLSTCTDNVVNRIVIFARNKP